MASSKPNNRVFVVGVGMTKVRSTGAAHASKQAKAARARHAGAEQQTPHAPHLCCALLCCVCCVVLQFEKPGGGGADYPDMAKEATTKALADAGLPYTAIEQACIGYVYGDSTAGQRALYGVGITGIPVYNVNNNVSRLHKHVPSMRIRRRVEPVRLIQRVCGFFLCALFQCSTGSTALFMAKQLVQGGLADCVLAMGFEKMEKGSLGTKYTDRANPLELHMGVMAESHGIAPKVPFAPQMFGNAGREHMKLYGTT